MRLQIASIYSKENFAELLQWLKGNGLVERQSWFEATPEILQSARDRDYRSKDLPIIEHAAEFGQNAGIAGLTDLPLVKSAFVSQRRQIEWTVSRGRDFTRGREMAFAWPANLALRKSTLAVSSAKNRSSGEMTLSVNLLAKGEVAAVARFSGHRAVGSVGFWRVAIPRAA